VNKNAAWSYAYTADARKLRDRSMRDGQSALAAAPSLKLIVVLLLSFGLWGAIWLALSSLASILLS